MRILWGFVLLLSLAIYSLPYVIKDQSLIWLKQQGINYPRLTEVSIGWHTGSIEIVGLAAHKPGFTPLQVDKLKLSLDLLALFEKRVLINSLELTGFNASFEQRLNETFVGPINISKLQDNKQPEPADESSQNTFEFGLNKLSLSDINFTLKIPKYQHQLHLEHANIEDLYQWAPKQLSIFAINGHFNDAPITINSESSPLSNQKQTALKLSLKNLPIASITRPFVKGLSATMDADIDIHFKANEQNFSIEHTGSFKLAAFKWQSKAQKFAFENLTYKGAGKLAINLAGHSQIKGEGELTLNNFELGAGLDASANVKNGPALKLATFKWQGPIEALLEKQALSNLKIAENFQVSGLQIKAPINLAIEEVTLQPGKKPLQIKFEKNLIQSIESSSTTHIKALAFSQKEANVAFASLLLNHTSPLMLKFNKGQLENFTDTTNLQVNALSVHQNNLRLGAKNISVSGPVSIANIGQSPLISSKLNTKTTLLKVTQDHLAISAGSIALAATLEQLDLQQPSIKQATLNMTNLDVSDLAQSLSLFSVAKLSVNDAAYSPTLTSLASLKAQNLKLAKGAATGALSQVSNLHIEQLKLINNNNLQVSSIALKDSSHHVQISDNGQIAQLTQLQKSIRSTSGNSKKKSAGNNDKFSFDIKRINISGNNLVNFEDKSVDPWFKSKINFSKITLNALSNSSNRPSPFAVSATLNEESVLNLNGKYALFGKEKAGQWQLTLDDFSLPIISPYAGRAAGYFLDSGKLNIKSKGNIEKGVIKGTNKVQVQQLAVRSAESDATAKTNQSLSMPLDLAIAVLEDSDGNIDLSVPISGSVDDPNFGYSSVVEIVAKKGMKQAALSILTKTLQPYGALLTVATTVMDAKDSGTFINLAPIAFKPGEADMPPKMHDYIVKLGKMLKERKKLKLKLCGNAVTADYLILATSAAEKNAALKKPLDPVTLEKDLINQLQNLATARTKTIKNALIQQKINDKRLFVCYAKVQLKDKKALPNVSLGL
jgi:hypothetical protein